MTVLFPSTHKPVFQTPVFCLFLYFHCLSTNRSGFHYILQTKHVPHTSSPELLPLVTMDSFCFHFLNTLCPALTQLSGSTQATMEKAMPLHIWFFSCVFFFLGIYRIKASPFWWAAFNKKEQTGVLPNEEKTISAIYSLLAECWFMGRKTQKKKHRHEGKTAGQCGWVGWEQERPMSFPLQSGYFYMVWVSTLHFPQL